MKKSLLFLLVMVLALGMVFVGCNKDTEPPAGDETTGDETTGDETTADDTVYQLDFAYFGGETITPALASKAAMDQATEQSNGRLQFTQYFGGTVLSFSDQLSGTSSGVVDISLNDSTMINEMFKLNTVFNVPFTSGLGDRPEVCATFREFLTSEPQLNQEMNTANLNWVSVWPMGGYDIHTASTSVKTPADAATLKIEALGYGVNFFDSIGASATSLAFADYYTAASTGLVNAQCTHWTILSMSEVVDFYKHHTVFCTADEANDVHYTGGGLYVGTMCFVCNLDTWNSLPEDLQQILMEAFDYAGDYAMEGDDSYIVSAKTTAIERGDEFVCIPAGSAEWQVWADAMSPVIDEWVASAEAAGYSDARAIYDSLASMLAETVK